MEQKNKSIPDFDGMARELLEDAQIFAEVTSLNFFKDSFHNQGWQGASFERWPDRKNLDGGRSILVKTANLRDSIRVLESSPLRLVFGTNEPYAQIHNEGGVISVPITAKSRRFFWYMHRLHKESGSSQMAAMWKAMALTKKSRLSIKIPQRRFIGESPALLNIFDSWLKEQIKQRFKTL